MYLSVIMGVLIAVFASMEPFDAMHQKRLFILHMENVGGGFYCVVLEKKLTIFCVYRSRLMNNTSISRLQMVRQVSRSSLRISCRSLGPLSMRHLLW